MARTTDEWDALASIVTLDDGYVAPYTAGPCNATAIARLLYFIFMTLYFRPLLLTGVLAWLDIHAFSLRVRLIIQSAYSR